MSEALAALVRKKLAEHMKECRVAFGEVTLEVPAEHLLGVCRTLRDETEFAFGQLVDLCGIDYLSYGQADWKTSEQATSTGYSRSVDPRAYRDQIWQKPRFAVAYHLLSHLHNQRLRLRVFAEGDPPRVDSVVEIWNSANWYEREAFDLFGICFEGHPDLRRILTDYGFVGHPFRKDFPLIGHVEMRYDPEQRRVVYEPVSIEPRTLVPRTIRHEYRSLSSAGQCLAAPPKAVKDA
jgi:NADH-quinone oxidoreductase subunit C